RRPDHLERRIGQLCVYACEGVEQDIDALDRVESTEIDDRGLPRASGAVRARDVEGGRDGVETSGISALSEVFQTLGLGQVQVRRAHNTRKACLMADLPRSGDVGSVPYACRTYGTPARTAARAPRTLKEL